MARVLAENWDSGSGPSGQLVFRAYIAESKFLREFSSNPEFLVANYEAGSPEAVDETCS